MIKKIISIKNIGKFTNFIAVGDVSFDKVNIVYGENSTGKTTLTSIIRSLKENNPDIIQKRRKKGTNEDLQVDVLCEKDQINLNCKFHNNKWENTLSNIEIFDVVFINKNVYTGLEISSEHQKGLYQFALGETGVALAKEIEELKNNVGENGKKIENFQKRIELITEKMYVDDDFINLRQNENITNNIEDKKRAIKIAEDTGEIKQKNPLSTLSNIKFETDSRTLINFATLKELLMKTIREISYDSLQQVENHKQRLSKTLGQKAESWLQDGLTTVDSISNSKCPFCQQDLHSAKLIIMTYQQYFNKEYDMLKQKINEYINSIEKFPINDNLNDINRKVLTNDTLIEFWKKYITATELPIVDLDNETIDLKAKFINIKTLIYNKSKSILEPIDTKPIDNLLTLEEQINKKINDYNIQVEIWNKAISGLKSKQLDIDTLRQDLKKLEIQQKRQNPEIDKICKDYRQIKQNISDAKDKIRDKQNELKQTIVNEVEKYCTEINKYLRNFGVNFQIEKLKQTYRGRSTDPYLEYYLAIEGHEINTIEDTKHCLSEGDKNALALAFFLAKLNLDSQINNKIVIFDDPVSSFDKNRRIRTVEYIRDLSTEVKQTIIFTHYDIFAFDLYDYFKKRGLKSKNLQISEGKIKEWKIDEQMINPYFQKISQLENYISGTLNIDACALIRDILEDALKLRYFQHFRNLGDNCWLGSMIEKLRTIKQNDTTFRFKHENTDEVLTELGNLCDFSCPSHHGNINMPHRTDKSPEEIKTYAKSTLKLVYEWL